MLMLGELHVESTCARRKIRSELVDLFCEQWCLRRGLVQLFIPLLVSHFLPRAVSRLLSAEFRGRRWWWWW